MNIIDRLGQLAAMKADILAEEKALKATLAPGSYEGELFRATVSVSERNTVNWKAVAEYLEPSRQLLTANTRRSETKTVRVSARNSVKVAA